MSDARTKRLNEARKEPGGHVGPHGSFPLTDAKSINSAYRLAGHAADPDAIRAKVVKKAKEKGLTSALPKTAKTHQHNLTRMTQRG